MSVSESYTSQIACRYYRLGICNKAENCQYSHNIENALTLPASTLRSDNNVLGLERHLPGLTQPTGSRNVENLAGQTDDNDNGLSKPVTASTAACHLDSTLDPDKWVETPEFVHPDSQLDADTWVKAAEFVPGQLWQSVIGGGSAAAVLDADLLNSCEYAVGGYSEAAAAGPAYYAMAAGGGIDDSEYHESLSSAAAGGSFAPVDMTDVCDMCGQLLPSAGTDEHLRRKHIQECIKQHEEEMELSFAIQGSAEKVCGICMEVVWEKDPEKEARFGILSNCCHVFCLSCIRRWRAAQQFDKKTVKSCPECRVMSNFVVPSRYWVEEEASKNRLIAVYQSELSKKHCKHFNRGKGTCPFNEKCFYLHAYPDGRVASPRPPRRRQHSEHQRRPDVPVLHLDADDDDNDIVIMDNVSLYDIIELLNERVTLLADRLEHSLAPLLHRHTTLSSSDDDE